MNVLSWVIIAAEEGEHHFDDKGYTTHHWLLPETAEIIYGGLASVIIFALLYKFAGPAAKKAMAARTERIQKELDDAAAAKAAADAEATNIRKALGDIESERAAIMAQADAQAEQLLAEGRTRLTSEVADLEAKADLDVAQLGSRASGELQAEIARLSGSAADALVADHIDASLHNDLIEAFIAKALVRPDGRQD